jgi:hypothetical protein
MSKEQPADAQPVAAGPAKVAENSPKVEEEGLLVAGMAAACAAWVKPATTTSATARRSAENLDGWNIKFLHGRKIKKLCNINQPWDRSSETLVAMCLTVSVWHYYARLVYVGVCRSQEADFG